MTDRARIHAASATAPSGDDVQRAGRIAREGGVVAFPTDTFYGLGADPLNRGAVQKIFEVKGRAPGVPVPVLIADLSDLGRVACGITPVARRVAEEFWPGPLTIVAPGRNHLPAEISAGTRTVGVRVPDHPVARSLARACGGAITGTSANLSGQPPMKSPDQVLAALGDRVDFVLLGECGSHSLPSTVVDFTSEPPRIIRTGAVSLADLRRVCPRVEERREP